MNNRWIKRIFSAGYARTFLILGAAYLFGICSTGYGNDTLNGIAWVLIVGLSMIVEVLYERKQE